MRETVKLIFDTGQTKTFECERLIRKLAGKREIYAGRLGGKEVVVKFFVSKAHRTRHFAREVKGIEKFLSRGLKAAELIAKGKSDSGEYFIALKKIGNAVDVFSIFEAGNDTDLLGKLQSKVFEYIATMHQAGVYQEDMHLGNFLWDGNDIYGLDVAEMKFYAEPLGKCKSLNQLAILLASIPQSGWIETQQLIERYFATRKWSCDSAIKDKLDSLVLKERLKQAGRYKRKIFRTTRRFLKIEQGCTSGVVDKKVFDGYDVSKLIGNLNSIIENGQILKDGNTCFVSKIDIAGKDVVVKRYNHKSWWHSFRYTIKGSRARKCWLFGHYLNAFDISSARPVAFFERRRFGLVWQSYILNEFVTGQELHVFLASEKYLQDQKDSALKKTRELLAKLMDFRMSHGDMKLPNTMIADGRAVLIDLDSMRNHRCWIMQRHYQKKMMRKFENRLAKLMD